MGRSDAFADLAADFLLMCRSRGWRVVVLGCRDERIASWRAGMSSLRAVPIGCDVEVDVPGFAMVGRRFRNLRQAVSRSHNRGITTQLIGEQDLGEALTTELAEVVYSSRHGARLERGFR